MNEFKWNRQEALGRAGNDEKLLRELMGLLEESVSQSLQKIETALAAGVDNHLVPREEMEETYLHDDKDELLKFGEESKIPIVVVGTDYEGMAHYKGIIEKITKAIKNF